MQPPSFSVIIPALNEEQHLAACLQSLRAQHYPPELVEMIVIDNGSRDRSAEIARSNGAMLIAGGAELTIAALRNLGAQRAHNAILLFVDADCLLSPEWLKIAAAHFANTKVAMVGSSTIKSTLEQSWLAKAWQMHRDAMNNQENPTWLPSGALAVRTQVFRGVGGFSNELRSGEAVALGAAISSNHLLVNDPQLAPLPLRCPQNIREFFAQEFWRGNDSQKTGWQAVLANPLNLFGKDGIALLLPYYYLLMLVYTSASLFVAAVSLSTTSLVIALSAIFLPIFGLSLFSARRTGASQYALPLFVLYLTYITARLLAFLANITGQTAKYWRS